MQTLTHLPHPSIGRASQGNLSVLEHILSHEDCDVDPINRLERATPLHLALQIDDAELRKMVVESLLEAGADTTYVDPSLSLTGGRCG